MALPNYKLLFCLPNNKTGGGNRVLMEIANRGLDKGCYSELLMLDGSQPPDWCDNLCTISGATLGQPASFDRYDFVVASNATSIARVLPDCGYDKLVFICQEFESYCYGNTPDELYAAKPELEKILKLPHNIVATSVSVQTVLLKQLQKISQWVPVAIDSLQFAPPSTQLDRSLSHKRILCVGDYLAPVQGIFDLADALVLLNKKVPVELVLITEQKAEREKFDQYLFPIEIHQSPQRDQLSDIYSSCDVYCNPSWYEGFGLACIESFAVGVPVVSTDNKGVKDFARDGENVLLAEVNSPLHLADKLNSVLVDHHLAARLIAGGLEVVPRFSSWDEVITRLVDVFVEFKYSASNSPTPTRAEMQELLKSLEASER